MDLRLRLAILVGKLTNLALRFKKSGATAAPGLYSLYLDKNALKKLSAPLNELILVTGTNGKTTTTRLIGNFLDRKPTTYIHNRHGSNLERGLVSAFIPKINLSGETKTRTGLFEVDEAALGQVLPKLKPTAIVITNLFRDQLDRYGEVDNIKRLWQKSLSDLTRGTNLILNADDPSVAVLGKNTNNNVTYFGINDPTVKLSEEPNSLDSSRCPLCHNPLNYSAYYSSHQGDYNCGNCDFKRPDLQVWAENIRLSSGKTEFSLRTADGVQLELESTLVGLFNVYNILAAYSVLKSREENLDMFPIVSKEFASVFGRGEKLQINNKTITVALAKNPTGFNEIIRTFLAESNQTVLIAINDKIADGRDVSWLWDVDLEKLIDKNHRILVSGIRGTDMNLRLKYAGIKNAEYIESLAEALTEATDKAEQDLLIIPTYTAMLDLKKLLAKKGVSGHFWED